MDLAISLTREISVGLESMVGDAGSMILDFVEISLNLIFCREGLIRDLTVFLIHFQMAATFSQTALTISEIETWGVGLLP
ncbi:MAG: hypothetical protein ACKN9V_01645 [Pseudomonadota bacterium]